MVIERAQLTNQVNARLKVSNEGVSHSVELTESKLWFINAKCNQVPLPDLLISKRSLTNLYKVYLCEVLSTSSPFIDDKKEMPVNWVSNTLRNLLW